MFTGIIEEVAQVVATQREGDNLHLTVQSTLTAELKIDQSVSHNGVCLTVVAIKDNTYTVTAIKETLDKSNINNLTPGSYVNLERAMKLGDRLDGHIVQGHVDQTAICTGVQAQEGSWVYSFNYHGENKNLTIEKGSITVNGVSLTVINSQVTDFSVAIIPYTYEHTNFKSLKKGDIVNLEFDVVGKYVQKLLATTR